MNTAPLPDLDLNFPFHDGPDFPPPQLDMKAYVRMVESLHQMMKKDGTLEGIIARRPRPVEEMFVLK